jgi:GT2 family glycosyltransferase
MSYSDATGRMRHRGVGEPLDLTSEPDWESAPAVSGCALLISREVFDAVGLLDEAYFFSFEDVAFCLAARDAGFDVGVAQSAVVFHEGSRTLGPTSVRRFYLATRNHLRVASARPSSSQLAGLARGAAIVGYNVAYAIKAPGGTLGARLGAVVRGTRDHMRGRYGADSDS